MTPCQICGEPSKFTMCGRCKAERQQHLKAKARARAAAFARRMEERARRLADQETPK